MNLHRLPLLLVEDNPAHAALMRYCLEDQALAVYHASDGEQAIDYLLRRGAYAEETDSPRPGMILLDLNLPKVSGLDVLSRIKASEALRAIPVVIFTTSEAERDKARAYALGADDYRIKPLGFDVLSDMLRQICRVWLTQ